MAFGMKGFDPGKGTGLNTRKINKAKKLTKKHVEHTTVDSPTYGTKKSDRKFPRSEKKMNKAIDLLRSQGYSEEEIEQFTGATGYKDAMDWATEPMVKSPMKKNGVGKLWKKAKAKIKNYITDKKLEGFEKYRSEKLGKKYVPASKKSKSPMKKNGNGKRGYDTGGFEAKEDAMRDGQDVEPTNKQKRQSRRQRNKYNKKALKNKPLSKAQIQNLTKQINNPNTSKESIKEFEKLLKLNKRINK